ncbi:putative DNA-binding protein [Bacillus sp. FJAT-44742]|uniref:putative DNA-binding protein n=1 Tax=Bacillus sp. FJAT-44742 TaxID=2014005 RepID=UPI000C245935|nr:putative DNA-binding protein [Bacillus sp. FJAT-44742]
MLEKTVRMNALFDFYQPLLTSKQQKYMELYFLDDYSLGEIAEEFDVSRQAVYDNIKRTEAMLEEYEQKLSLYSKYKERTSKYKQLKALLGAGGCLSEEIGTIIASLEKIEEEGMN